MGRYDRAGVVSGTDQPLPPDCQTATCIHREHQLHRVHAHSPVVVSTGWCMPASRCAAEICTRYDMHEEGCRTQGWDLDPVPWDGTVAGLPPEVTEGTLVRDPFEDFLDLPEIKARRGGIRHSREFTPRAYDVERNGMLWYVYQTDRTSSLRIGHGKWTKRAALRLRDSLRSAEEERFAAWNWEPE